MTKYGLGWFLWIRRKVLDHLSQKLFPGLESETFHPNPLCTGIVITSATAVCDWAVCREKEKRERGRGRECLSLPASLPPKKILSWENLFKWDHRSTATAAVWHRKERGESGNGGWRRRPPLWAECPHLFEWGGITHAETADRHLLGHCPYWEGGGGIGEEMGHVMVGYAFSDDAHSWSDIVLWMEDTKLRGWVY